MSVEDFAIPLQTKLHGTRLSTEALGSPHLEFFIMLSSVFSITSNSAQANYAAGNAFLDALTQTQSTSNTHFISLNLGPMRDVGVVAEHTKLEQF